MKLGPEPRMVFVDVDGTLAGLYHAGKRDLRPGSVEALRRLSRLGPVVLWSVAGKENADRLLAEYPALSPHVSGTAAKSTTALPEGRLAYCVDDLELDDCVLLCARRAIVSSYLGGEEDHGELLAAVATLEALAAEEG